jgi:hypothetical protein
MSILVSKTLLSEGPFFYEFSLQNVVRSERDFISERIYALIAAARWWHALQATLSITSFFSSCLLFTALLR